MNTLVERSNTTAKTIRAILKRLILKGLIQREQGKTGKGGFYSFSVSEIVRNAAIEYKRTLYNSI